VQETDPALTTAQTAELRWLCESLILTKPATASVLVHVRGRTVARYGVMGSSSAVAADAPIVAKALREAAAGSSKETYLPALQNLPGKVEFSYLPENCQTVLLLPLLGGEAVVVVGGSQARAYTPKDIAWIKGVCERAGASLLD
jgi:Cofactor assembly of complex C subunit B, CCB2/CCB4